MTVASPYIPGHYLLHLMETGLLPPATTRHLHQHLEKTGVDTLQLSDARLAPQSLEALLQAWPEIQPQALAIAFGRQVTLTSQGGLSLLLMTAPTLRKALQLTAFLPLLTNAASLHYFENPQGGHLQIQPHSGAPLLDKVLALYACAALEQLAVLLTGKPCHCQVQVAMEYGASLPLATRNIAPQWQWDAVVSTVTLPNDMLELPCQHADSITHAHLLQQCENLLARKQHAEPVVTRIRHLLAQGKVEPDQETVARALNMSRSTLKRHLAREHTNFQAVLTAFRKEKAIRLLLGSTLSLQDIAEQLGYSDQTNFSHAFKQWSGMTPGQFRKHSQ
ncbi:MAG: helix-turn-helix domain-containing protein [Alcanivorax sp.]|nr:helix-turn-helix domain-containing protein [Alcanivorax sp.]